MFGHHKDTKRELTPQEQKMVIDELNDILNNPELKEEKIVFNVEISDGLVDYDGVTNQYRDLGDVKVIKASWSKLSCASSDERYNKILQLDEDIKEFNERLKAKHHIRNFGDALIVGSDQIDYVEYFFYNEED